MMVRLLAVFWALAVVVHGQSPRRWPGWNDYQVLIWSTDSALDRYQWIDRLRELGFTGEQCTIGCDAGPFVSKGFGFYVENLVAELAFLHSRQALYDADWQGYTTTRDKKYLLRKPSFHDPAFWSDVKPRLQNYIVRYAGQQPLMYQLRDELSIGRFANPMDYCFDPNTLREFRLWLRGVYGTLDALNREWETAFASWDDVVPMTTYEIKERERTALAGGRPENYAPWADHREFMDLAFAQTLDRLRGLIREIDPAKPVGIEGTQMPSAWGGFDLWRMSQAVDWIEPYDIAGSREVFRSFLPPGTPVLSTVFGSDFPRIRRKLWWLLLHGDSGALVWDDDEARAILKREPGQPVTGRGRGLADAFAELKQVTPLMMNLRRIDDRIAIHYSQASIRAHWMFDSREDGTTWPRRFSSYEATYSRFARARDSFMRIVEDLGLQYNFVSYDQIENGELLSGGYKVLMLPQSVAMSEREARAIETFVRQGGTVIADNMTATMNERCRRLEKGQLDDLFGIRRTGVGWSSAPLGGQMPESRSGVMPLTGFERDITVISGASQRTGSGVPVIVENPAGMGRAVYLNLYLHEYGKHRLTPPRGDGIRELFARILKDSGVEAPVIVVSADGGGPAPCVEVWRYSGEDGEYVAIMRNPEFNLSSLKAAGYPDNTEVEKPLRIRIIFRKPGALMDIRGGAIFYGSVIETTLDPWSPVILKRLAEAGNRQSAVRPSPPGRHR